MLTQLYAPLRDAGFRLDPGLEEAVAELNKFYTVSRYPDAAGAEELLIKLGYGGTPGGAKRCE